MGVTPRLAVVTVEEVTPRPAVDQVVATVEEVTPRQVVEVLVDRAEARQVQEDFNRDERGN